MPKAMAVLLLMQLLGEVTVRLLHIPVPGPVVGMLYMFIWLVSVDGPDKEVAGTVNGLLQNMALLFVPAGVGIMAHGDRLKSEGIRIVIVLIVSTLLTMLATLLTYRYLSKKVVKANTASTGNHHD
ncbi:CidA/LrgA family protein [Leeia sp. TBRC 13508]|uniref:CidA/LrgA family protein n=1 Tax=Leeia speluncae TaxID=2884804 RepID=A0ABS8DB55_9NEIS|nr:CidA/LrgA family protein [Leeia speluncae]MCB6185357.1 CidA/LrgA family protein [Leeia speluncae]